MNLFCRYWFWFARMQGTLPKSSKTPDLKGRLNRCVTHFNIPYLGFPELPLFQTAFTYFNVTKSQLIPGFIKGSVAKVALTLKP